MAPRRLSMQMAGPLRFTRASAKGLAWLEPDKSLLRSMLLHGPAGEHLARFVHECAALTEFVAAGIDAPSRALFVGETGTGKTMAVRWLGASLDRPIAMIELSQIIGSYMGSTGEHLARVVEALSHERQSSPILFFDEVDALGISRGKNSLESGSAQETHRIVTMLIQQLDALPPDQVVIGATNIADAIDPAIRRRFHEEIRFDPPGSNIRRAMVDMWLAKASVSESDRASLVAETEGIGGAELRARAMALGRAAIMARRHHS